MVLAIEWYLKIYGNIFLRDTPMEISNEEIVVKMADAIIEADKAESEE